jgi:ribonuclease III
MNSGDFSEIYLDEFLNRNNLETFNRRLFLRALTHRSYLNEHPDAVEDNERLEFLGDAVLDFLVGAWLYNEFPEMQEGELTKLRSALVKTEQLADFAQITNLGVLMRLGRGEEDGGGRNRPALLCATFEALIGAIYLQAGISGVQKFFQPFVEKAVYQILSERKEQDPKSNLQEWAQANGYGPPIYQTIATSGPEHDKIFEIEVLINHAVYGTGSGHSKQAATKAAARNALAILDIT